MPQSCPSFIRQHKRTDILLVEQNASKALEICHRGYVFEIGTIALEGSRNLLSKDDRVKKILIGG